MDAVYLLLRQVCDRKSIHVLFVIKCPQCLRTPYSIIYYSADINDVDFVALGICEAAKEGTGDL
jgi:hypothetical protein